MGRSPTFPLLPMFRSAALVAVLEQLYVANPDRRRSVADIARAAGVPYATAHRDVQRLDDAGLVRTEHVGTVRLVGSNPEHPAHQPLQDLITLAAGPRYHLADAIGTVQGVTHAYIFGSWAARYLGHRGEAPGDIDVLVVGRVDPQGLYERIQPVEEFFGCAVNTTLVAPDDWAHAQSGFLQSVQSGPLVSVVEDAAVTLGDDH